MKFQFKTPTFYATALLIALLLFSIAATGPAAGQDASSTTLDGWFSTLFGTPPQGVAGVEGTLYGLTTDDGRHFTLDIDPAVLQAAGGFGKLNGSYVRVGVAALTDRSVLTDGGNLSVQSLELAPLPLRIPAGAAGIQPVSGAQPWVTILCAFPGTPDGYGTNDVDYFQGMYSDQYPGMDHYWRQQSYGKVNLTGSHTYGWFTLDNAQTSYFPAPGTGTASFGTLTDLAQDCIDKADSSVDFTPYKGINFMFNGELDCCAWGGVGLVMTDGVNRNWRLTWNPPFSWKDITVVSHEIGHGFGLPHANNYDLDNNPYDNTWDVMSETYIFCAKAYHPTYGCLGQHTNAYYKDVLGWFGQNRRLQVSADQPSITLDHVAMQNSTNIQIVIIPIPGTNKRYVVEARQTSNSNYDAKLAGKAVIIHEIDDTRQEWAWLVGGTTDDKSASVENNQANPDGAWLVGETYTDSTKGISISVLSETTNGFVIAVDVPDGIIIPTSTPGGPTETPGSTVNLVRNGDMESATDNEDLPDDWAFKNLTGDKLKCNKPDKVVSYGGNCAFLFKGGLGEASKLSQNYTPTGNLTGPVSAELFTQGSNEAVSGKMLVKVIYFDDSDSKLTIDIFPSGSYVYRSGSLEDHGSISKVKITLKNDSLGGKFYVDNVKVNVN
jgi:M6 family metalloprotease-like protein